MRLSPISVIVALIIVVLLFGGAATLSYDTVRRELLGRQQLDHQKLSRIVTQSLEHYFRRVQQATDFAASLDAFEPERTEAEDQYRYRAVDKSKAEAVKKAESIEDIIEDKHPGNDRQILIWQLFKGLPKTDDQGKLLAEERRRVAVQTRNAFHDILFVFEEDANGDIVFVVPFEAQKNLRNFNYSFRDYLAGPKKTAATTLSEAYISRDARRTHAISVSSPVFNRSRSVAKIVAASVSNETLRKAVFQPLKEGVAGSDNGGADTVFYFIDKHGHVVASSSDNADYTPVHGAPTDEGERGVVRNYGPLRQIQWQDDEFEKKTEWERRSKSWINSSLLASYSDEYENSAGTQVLGTFYPVSLIDKRPFRYGILIETPTNAIKDGQRNLGLIFMGTAVLLLAILYGLGRAIWISYTRLTSKLDEKDLHLEQVLSRVSHDLRSPLVALQVLQPHIQDQPENVRTMYLRTLNQIQDIANDLVSPKKD